MITSINGHLVAEKLHRFRARITPLQRNSIVHPHGNAERYTYAPIDDILAHVGKPLARFGLYISQSVTGDCGVCTRLWHVSGEWIEDTATSSAKTLDDKAATITRLRRYALITMLGLPTVDGDQTTQPRVGDELLKDYNDAQRLVIIKTGIFHLTGGGTSRGLYDASAR